MTLSIFAAIACGSFAIGGGIAGYRAAGSKPSLISGIASGSLLLLSALLQWQGIAWGLWLGRAVAVLLAIVFAKRWFDTRKVFPAAVGLGAGVFTVIATFSGR